MTELLMKQFALSEKGAKDLIKGMIWSALSFCSTMFPMAILIKFLSEVLVPTLQGEVVDTSIWTYLLYSLIIIIAMIPFIWMQHTSVYIATYNESAAKRITLAEKLRKLPLSFFGQRDLTDLTTTIMGDATAMEHVLSHAVPQLAGAIIFTFIVMLALLINNWKMGIALFWVFPISLILIFASKSMQYRAGHEYMQAKVENAAVIQEALENVREIKAFNYKQKFLEKVRTQLLHTEKLLMKYEVTMDSFLGVGQAFLQVGVGTTILVGTSLLVSNEISLMNYFLYLLASSKIYAPLSGALTMILEIFNSIHPTERMKSIENQKSQTGSGGFNPDGYDVVFEDVVFGYNENEDVLHSLSFKAKQNEITALVGPSGSGKSTATRLVSRFWDIKNGTIKIGGVDISGIDPEVLLRDISIVFQDVVLFNNTIMENIRIGKKDATDEEVMQAAKLAMCEDFIDKLPDKYDTLIGENGARLSGGERQRISIARAILKDAPILLLDEATASVDVENETAIQTALSKLIENKTVIVIAHRMRTVAGADHVIVLKEGELYEEGRPAELIKANGLFARMNELQMESSEWDVGTLYQ